MHFNMKGSTVNGVTIDGVSFAGKNISITGNGKVVVDGVEQAGSLIGDVNVIVDGDIDRLEVVSGSITAKNVSSVKTTSGDVECADVSGSVSTMSGDIDCRSIGGSVSTMSGDITQR